MRKIFLSIIIVLALGPTLACNLGGLLGGSGAPQIELPQADSESTVEPAETGSPVVDEPASTPAGDEATAEIESESVAETDEAAETTPPEAEASESGADEEAVQADAGSAGATSGVKVELDNVAGLDDLSAYRVLLTMDLMGQTGGQPVEGRLKMLLEETTDPAAQHVAMEMTGPPTAMLGGTEKLELYQVDGVTYIYNEMLGNEWVTAPSDGSSDPLSEGMFSPEEELQLPDSAICAEATEIVNDIEARYCTFDEVDLTNSPGASYGSAEGEVWLSVDGNYVVKYAVTMTDFKPAPEDQSALFESGDLTITYDLLEANTGFTITVPEEATQAGGLDLDDLGGESSDFPVMDGAQELMSFGGITNYKTDASVAEAVEFYRTELAALGWNSVTVDGLVTDTSAILTFENDSGASLLVTIAEEAGQAVITLLEATEE
ncbi:MAG TPA: hypothetical protein PKE64_17815 [Anaerolineae bacterium]|nr:hypothetical protein [Anaerolineae bacterium]HMR65869.1 hypothetical protein [Anaerolineae bacterium]